MSSTRNYRSLPHNSRLKARGKELRRAGILHEALMWNQLKQRKLNGLDFDRQKIIGNYIVDFFCAERTFVLEIDGDSHEGREDYDFQRDSYLTSLGLIVLRIRCEDVLERMDRVVELLREHPALASLDEDLG